MHTLKRNTPQDAPVFLRVALSALFPGGASLDVFQSPSVPAINEPSSFTFTNPNYYFMAGGTPVLIPKVKYTDEVSDRYSGAEVSVVGHRKTQEDNALMKKNLVGLFDGHGSPVVSYMFAMWFEYIYHYNLKNKKEKYQNMATGYSPTEEALFCRCQAISDAVHSFDLLIGKIWNANLLSENYAAAFTALASMERDVSIQSGKLSYGEQFDHDKLYKLARSRFHGTPDVLETLKELCNDLNVNHAAIKSDLIPQHDEDLLTRKDPVDMKQLEGYAFKSGGGSTATIGELVDTPDGTYLLCANLGDSETMLVRNGRAISCTRKMDIDNNNIADVHRARKAGGMVYDGYLCNGSGGGVNMTGAVGDLGWKQSAARKDYIMRNVPEFTAYKLCKEDEFIVLYCDGVGNSMPPQMVADRVKSGYALLKKNHPEWDDEKICAKLGEDLVQNSCIHTYQYSTNEEGFIYGTAPKPMTRGGGYDNASAMVIRLSDKFRESLPENTLGDVKVDIVTGELDQPMNITHTKLEA